MSQQGRPLESGEYYLPSNLLPSQGVGCIDADSPPTRLGEPAWHDDDQNTYDNSSEDGTICNEESLHPSPLNLEEGRRRTGNQQARHLMLPLETSSPDPARGQIYTHDQQLINSDSKNKPLPLSPRSSYSVSMYSEPVKPNFQFPGLDRELRQQNRHVQSSDYKKGQKSRERRGKFSLLRVLGDRRIGKYAPPPKIARTLLSTPYQHTSSLETVNKLNEQDLLQSFFGFDRSSQLHKNATMREIHIYLRNQPQPDSVTNKKLYPLVCCAWLRNFIVDSLHTFDSDRNFDRGRLLGLQLKDESTQNVHRGFGLLWNFLEARGPNARKEHCRLCWRGESDKDAELRWFQHENVQPTETEDMLQIWKALKLLLLKHSAERQVQGQADRHAVNVISFMKRGLGEIQRYLAKTHEMDKPFWDGSKADTFFAEACRKWQDG